MIGQPYAPNVVDSSAALLALAAIGERTGVAAPGCRVLAQLAGETRSALGLAWAALALGAQGMAEEAARVRGRLAEIQDDDGSWRRDVFATALAALTLGGLPGSAERGPA